MHRTFFFVVRSRITTRLLTILGSEVADAEGEISHTERKHTHKVDTWALGIIAMLLLTADSPVESPASRHSDQATIDLALAQLLLSGHNVSEDGQNFVYHCLRVDPEERLSDGEAIRHPWFTRPAEDLRRFEACDQEALGGWKPRRHICPMMVDLRGEQHESGRYTIGTYKGGFEHTGFAKKASAGPLAKLPLPRINEGARDSTLLSTKRKRNQDTPQFVQKRIRV